MTPSLDRFISTCTTAFSRHLRGDPEPFLACWSRRPDTAMLGAMGSYALGPAEIRAHLCAAAEVLDWIDLAVEPLLVSESSDLAVTVALEHMRRTSGGASENRTLRATQAYRREQDGWRLFARHANAVSAEDQTREHRFLHFGA